MSKVQHGLYGLYDFERIKRKIATIWLIPKNAKKPIDGRTKRGKGHYE